MRTLCFTGHRKLGGAYDGVIHKAVYDALLIIIQRNHDELGYAHFISGGAIGVDQIAADAVLYLRDIQGLHMTLTIARPFPSQGGRWPAAIQANYQRILDHADKIVDVYPDPYAGWKMMKRNIWMVDHSDKVIAIWDGRQQGGTWNCLLYAKKQGKEIVIIDPNTLKIYRW